VIEQRPLPRLERARAPGDLVALDDDATDFGESLAGGGRRYGVTALSEWVSALSDGFAVLLGSHARVGEGVGVGWAKAHLLFLSAERVAENSPLPAFVVGAQKQSAAVRMPAGASVGDLGCGQFVETFNQGFLLLSSLRSVRRSHQNHALR
jgi:hypothetical protein